MRKGGERAAARRAKQELFESEESALFDTAEPFEVPFEGDFPDRGTFSFWLNPVWDQTSQDDASFVTVADGRLRIVKNVSFLRYETVDADGNGDGIGVRITDWQPGEWHFVTATWDEGVHRSLRRRRADRAEAHPVARAAGRLQRDRGLAVPAGAPDRAGHDRRLPLPRASAQPWHDRARVRAHNAGADR